MTKLSPEAQALLDAGRDALSPTRATKESVLRSIDASLASGTAAAGSGLFATSKLWLALTLVAGIGGGWFLFRDTPVKTAEESAAVAKVPAVVVQPAETIDPVGPALLATNAEPTNVEPQTVESATVETAIVEPAMVEPQAKTAAKPAIRKPTAPKPKAADPLAEQKLLASAQRAIRDKNYSEARSLLSNHEKNFPKGILVPERQAARAMVNCLEPTGTNGKAIARRFLERHASSPLAARVRSICKLEE